LKEMIVALRKEYPATHLVSTVHLSKLSFLYRGETLERLPGSVIAQLIPGLSEPAIVATTPVRTTQDTGKIILGSVRVTVKVK
ncbi:MAG TPA: hypothetical protein VI643_04195, partial [Planctomycetota bacterium]|nr:hypothetical protein [Planctomycetota bacterium]